MALTLTVSEIAAMLEDAPERRSTLVERIRHWTREGLLQPIGEKNPGTGRHREYETDALIDVAVLNLLANLGLQVGQQQRFVEFAREIYSANKKNHADWGEVFLAISSHAGEKPKFVMLFTDKGTDIGSEAHLSEFYATSDAFVIINIGRIYKNVTQKIEDLLKRAGEENA
jgi:DNA-binding transcriptional MerR regulator